MNKLFKRKAIFDVLTNKRRKINNNTNNNTNNNNTNTNNNNKNNNNNNNNNKNNNNNNNKNNNNTNNHVKSKEQIPKRIRELVWTTYNGEVFTSKCYVSWCTNKINVFSFQTGHDIPESKGGTLDIDNLKPICGSCNLSMSNKYSITEWSKLIKPIPILKTLPTLPTLPKIINDTLDTLNK